ncbi:Gramicidin S synthase 2 [compost metagenome]
MYRTGDIGRWLEDGRIEFLGRKDNQIKIRGIRIEPAEIEACLNKFPEIKDVLVVKKEYKDFSYLLAYYVANEQISPDDLKFFLSSLLPDYMVPLQYVFVPEMSMTITGKIDRNSLPEPEFDSMEYVAPETATEEKLVEIWSALLGIEKEEISVTTSFFHIGGHSLNAMAFSSEVYQFFNIKIPLKELFIRPTIRFTADYIDKQMLIDEHPDNQMMVSL